MQTVTAVRRVEEDLWWEDFWNRCVCYIWNGREKVMDCVR